MARPRKVEDESIDMLEVVRWFYVEGWPKQRIAKELELLRGVPIDVRTVARTLQRALDSGMVRILIRETPEKSTLELELKSRYPHLQKVLILPSRGPVNTPTQYGALLQRFGVVAASFFEEMLERRTKDKAFRVGISGGETLLEFVNAVPERVRNNVHIHATTVVPHMQLAMSASHVDPSTNATILWAKCGRLPGHCNYTTMTPYDTNERGLAAQKFIRRTVVKALKNSSIEAVIKGMQNLDMVFTGLGTLEPPRSVDPIMKNRLTMMSLLEPLITVDQLADQGAIGDLSYSLIDSKGDSRKDWQFFPTVGDGSKHPGVEYYRYMVAQGKTVVAIAGPFKLLPIKAALRGKLVNTIITDEDTAIELAKST